MMMAKDSELDNYLDDLLMGDEAPSADIEKDEVEAPATKDEQSDYKIYTFPSPANNKKLQQDSIDELPVNQDRHKIERMERLLDDFNRRQETYLENDLPVEISGNVLQPDVDVFSKSEHAAFDGDRDIRYINGILQPLWADEEFEVMIVEAGGLRIAVPEFSLGSIHSIKDSKLDTNVMPRNSHLFIGTAEINHMKYPLIDCCRWMMPEQYSEIVQDDFAYTYYMTHNNSHYALAVNAVHTSLQLDKSEIKWRRADSKRPWVAGMLTSQRAILVELDHLISHIHKTLA